MRLIGYREANAGLYSHTPRNNPACNLNLQPAIRESDQFYSISIKLLDNCLLCPIGSLFRTAIQQFTSLPVNGRIEFLECFDAIGNRTTSRSCKRNYCFAGKFILLNKRVYRTGHRSHQIGYPNRITSYISAFNSSPANSGRAVSVVISTELRL